MAAGTSIRRKNLRLDAGITVARPDASVAALERAALLPCLIHKEFVFLHYNVSRTGSWFDVRAAVRLHTITR